MRKMLFFYLLFVIESALHAEKVLLKNNNSWGSIEVDKVLSVGYGSKVSEIKFESENPKITEIILEGTAFIKDYSFIAECKELEVIVINDVPIENLDFLKSCKRLNVIAFDGVNLKKFPDLSNFENLEYFAMTNCNLKEFSDVMNHGKKLSFVNLCHNRISKFPKPKLNDDALYFVLGNPATSSNFKNYIFDEDITKKLPERFVRYVR